MQQRRSPRWARTHLSILVAAEELFDRQGVDSTSVVDIATRAEVAVGSLYSHFESKEALALALVEQALERSEPQFAAARVASTPLARAFAVGRAFVGLAEANPVAGRSLLTRGVDPRGGIEPDPARRRIEARMAEFHAEIERELQEAIEGGAVSGSATATDAARLLIAVWNGVATMLVQRDGDQITPDVAAQVMDLAEATFAAGFAVKY